MSQMGRLCEEQLPFTALHALIPNITALKNNIRFPVEEDNAAPNANNRLVRTTFPGSLYAGTSMTSQ